MTETRSPDLDIEAIAALRSKLASSTEATQRETIERLLEYGEAGARELLAFLRDRCHDMGTPTGLDGKMYRALRSSQVAAVVAELEAAFPQGLVTPRSEAGIDYQPLQILLMTEAWEEADRQTTQLLCQAAGTQAAARGWLYFTEVKQIPITDLQTLDLLWVVYSEGKFGFSVQRRLWLSLNKNWEKFWLQIGWKRDGSFTRYPTEFTWSLAAPRGHLPLTNQIRGKRTLEALLTHPLWG